MANPDDPTTNDVTEQLISNALERAQRSFPAIVSSYDGATMRATVQPALRIRARNGQQLTPKPVEVPVAWESLGEFVIQGKLSQGDEVVVECMDKNWRAWLLDGGVRDYNSVGGRAAGYGMAKPLQLSATRRPGPLRAGDEVTIGKRDGTSTVILRTDGSVYIQSGSVRLGSAAPVPALAVARNTDPVPLNPLWATWLGTVTALFNAPPGPMVSAPGTLVPGPASIGTISATSTEVSST